MNGNTVDSTPSEPHPTNPRRGVIPPPIAESYAKLDPNEQADVSRAFLSAEGDPQPEPAFPAPAATEVDTSAIEADYARRMAGLLASRDEHLRLFENRILLERAEVGEISGPSKHSLMLSVLSAQRAIESCQKAKERALFAAHAEAGIKAAYARAEELRLAGGSETQAQLIEAEAEVQFSPSWRGDLRAVKGRVFDLKQKLAREAATEA